MREHKMLKKYPLVFFAAMLSATNIYAEDKEAYTTIGEKIILHDDFTWSKAETPEENYQDGKIDIEIFRFESTIFGSCLVHASVKSLTDKITEIIIKDYIYVRDIDGDPISSVYRQIYIDSAIRNGDTVSVFWREEVECNQISSMEFKPVTGAGGTRRSEPRARCANRNGESFDCHYLIMENTGKIWNFSEGKVKPEHDTLYNDYESDEF